MSGCIGLEVLNRVQMKDVSRSDATVGLRENSSGIAGNTRLIFC